MSGLVFECLNLYFECLGLVHWISRRLQESPGEPLGDKIHMPQDDCNDPSSRLQTADAENIEEIRKYMKMNTNMYENHETNMKMHTQRYENI